MRLWYIFLFSKQLSQRSRTCWPTWHRTTALQNDGEKTISAFEIRPPFCRRSHLTSDNKGEAQNTSCSEKYLPYLSLLLHHYLPGIVKASSSCSLFQINYSSPQTTAISHTQSSNPQWLSDSLLNPPHFLSLSASQSFPPAPGTSTLILSKSLNSTSLWAIYLLSCSNISLSLHRCFPNLSLITGSFTA